MKQYHTALYSAYDSEGDALYIGVTGDWTRRWREHRAFSPWFYDVVRLDIQWFRSKFEALEAERRAIHFEHPKYNWIGHGECECRKPKTSSPSCASSSATDSTPSTGSSSTS